MKHKTFDDLWNEYKPRRVKGNKTEGETIRLYDKYVQPAIGSRALARIAFKDLEALHHSLAETPYQANRVLAVLRPMYKYAQALQWVGPAHNPAKLVKRYPERKRRRHMKPREAPRIARAIRNKETVAPAACLFLWLLIFTGARPDEIKRATWADLKGSRITLWNHKGDYKGTERVIVLPPAAMEKLKLVPRGQPWEKIISIGTPEYIWRTIRQEKGCADMRVYDLRHTFATYALEQGYSLAQIGESLDHASEQTTKIYAEMNTRSRQRIALDASTAILADMDVEEIGGDDDPLS